MLVDQYGKEIVTYEIIAQPSMFKQEVASVDSPFYEKSQLKPYNPDELYQKRGGYYLFDDMREDDQIHAILALKKFIILNSDWEIDSENEEIKEFLEYALTEELDGMFISKLFKILTAIDYGFSLTEKIAAYTETKDFGEKMVFKKLKTRPPHSFEFYTDRFGNIEYIKQHSDQGEKSLDYNKFMHYAYQEEFSNPYGKSDMNLGVYKAYWSKNAILKFFNIYLERYGMPLAVGKIPKGGDAYESDFITMLKNLQAKTSFTLPEGFEVDFVQASQGGEKAYTAAIDKYNMMMARAMLIPDLLGIGGSETEGGSYSLGQEHFRIFYTTIEFVRAEVAQLVNNEIINPLVRWNYGPKEEAEFKFNAINKETENENTKLWLDGVKSGKIPITHGQINWFLRKVEAEEITEDEYNEIEKKKEEMRNAIQGQDKQEEEPKKEPGKKPGVPEKEKEEVKDDKKDEKKLEVTDEIVKEYEYYRGFTEYERKTDYAKVERDTEALFDEHIEKVAKQSKQSINMLINVIKSQKIIEKKRLEQINKLEFPYMRKMTKVLNDVLTDSWAKGLESVERPKNYALVDMEGMNQEDAVKWMDENAVYAAQIEAEEIMKNCRGIILDGIRSGESTKKVIDQIAEALAGYDVAVGATRLDITIKTLIAKSYNEARANQYREMSDFIEAFQYSAILDGRTSPLCLKLDKKIFKATDDKMTYFNPPNHYRCRSLLIPIFTGEEYELTPTGEMPKTENEKGGFLKLIKEKK